MEEESSDSHSIRNMTWMIYFLSGLGGGDCPVKEQPQPCLQIHPILTMENEKHRKHKIHKSISVVDALSMILCHNRWCLPPSLSTNVSSSTSRPRPIYLGRILQSYSRSVPMCSLSFWSLSLLQGKHSEVFCAQAWYCYETFFKFACLCIILCNHKGQSLPLHS